ncbi:MAG: hypothetical protein AB7P76_00915 [Candidatus Melainabacteria bacterium]
MKKPPPRSKTLKLMDELEAMVMKRGWPVPFTPLYVVHHEAMLNIMDALRNSLKEELARKQPVQNRHGQPFPAARRNGKALPAEWLDPVEQLEKGERAAETAARQSAPH